MKIFKRIDAMLEAIEKYFSGVSLFTITALILLGVFLRTFFHFGFSWLEELCQYIMVWIVCIGCVLSVRGNEHINVDVIFSVLPKKFHSTYRTILAFVCAVFLIFFARYSLDLMLRVKKTGQVSVAMPWLQMYVLYIGIVLGSVLLLYEYIKLFIRLLRDIYTRKQEGKIPLEKFERFEGR